MIIAMPLAAYKANQYATCLPERSRATIGFYAIASGSEENPPFAMVRN